jgi:hypothetical protein
MRPFAIFAVLCVWSSAGAEAQGLSSFEVFVPHLSSPQMGIERPLQRVLSSEVEWQTVWSEIQRRTDEAIALPEVDWQRSRMLVIALGSRPSGGYAVAFGSVREFEAEIQVEVYELMPGEACIVTTGITYPIGYALIRRTEKPVRILVSKAAVSCSL